MELETTSGALKWFFDYVGLHVGKVFLTRNFEKNEINVGLTLVEGLGIVKGTQEELLRYTEMLQYNLENSEWRRQKQNRELATQKRICIARNRRINSWLRQH